MEVSDYVARLAPIYAGERFLVAVGPAAAATRTVQQIRALGAERCLVLAQGTGVGELPGVDDAECLDISDGARPSGIMEAIRGYQDQLRNPSAAVRSAIDAFDRERRARVIAGHYLDLAAIHGRPRHAARLPAWVRLEDKVLADALWQRAGVRHAPYQVVDAGVLAELCAAGRRLDVGAGCVWSGDSREGTNGGATYLRLVRNDTDAERVWPFFRDHCDRVRIMPFLDGVPCSIHGIVFPDRVIALRPAEMVCFRRAGRTDLLYAGTSTYYDPPVAVRQTMEDVAQRVGEQLRAEVAYRGGFTIDGIATAGGFLPTELNTRAGAALEMVGAALPELPLRLIIDAVAQGEDIDFAPERLRDLVVSAADRQRAGAVYAMLQDASGGVDPQAVAVKFIAGRAEVVEAAAEDADGTLRLGPGPTGRVVNFAPNRLRTPVGEPLARRGALALALADRLWDTGIGDLLPARAL